MEEPEREPIARVGKTTIYPPNVEKFNRNLETIKKRNEEYNERVRAMSKIGDKLWTIHFH